MKSLRIPYGISNYEKLITENYYFIDKTPFVERLEETGAPYLFFLRPRRFGKSLFVSMLEHYYDLARKDEFDKLFGSTYIGQNPTPLHNSFPILKFNFSMIPTDGTFDEIRHSFWLYVTGEMEIFLNKYADQFNIDLSVIAELKKTANTGDAFLLLHKELVAKKVSFYLIIDEYDNFANNILAEHGRETYIKSTHAGGFLRSFFTIIKGLTDNKEIDRLFITGVSPLVMADVTSGFNIGDNISTLPEVATLAGLNKDELQKIIEYYLPGKFDALFPVLHEWYGNYCFDAATQITDIYNTTSILYFIKQYLSFKRMPYDLIDTNLRTDYGKMRYLLTEQRKLNGNFKMLTEIAEKKKTSGRLVKSFSLSELISKEKFRSLLYYLGFTTLKQIDITGKITFHIPNKLIDELLWEYVRKALNETYSLNIDADEISNRFNEMAEEGIWKPLFNQIIAKFYEAVSVRDFVFHEEGLKTFMLAWLNLSNLYDIFSEKEQNKGFADISMLADRRFVEYVKYDYAIELKYLKSEDISTDKKKETTVKNAKTDAISQLEQYTSDARFQTKRIVIVASAKELLLMEEVEK